MGPESVGAMIGGALVVLHIGGTWLREYRKHRTWRANGKDIGEIKQDVKAVKEEQISQGKEISAMAQSVNDQKENCKVTVGRITQSMSDFNKELLAQAKNKRR